MSPLSAHYFISQSDPSQLQTLRAKLAKPVADLTAQILYPKEDDELCICGGNAGILKAQLNGQTVAVKVMRDIHVSREQRGRLVRRINRELRIWSMLQTHTNILPLLGYCFYGGRNYASTFSLVSPWMKNGTATSFVASRPEADRLKLLVQVLEGLSFLHHHNVVHGDLKGDNILIADDGTALLADFGVSRLIESDSTMASESATTTSSSITGTIRWMAPEVVCGSESVSSATIESDVWAVGCILLELVGNIKPYARYKHPPNIIFAMMHRKAPFEYDSRSMGPGNFKDYPGLWTLCLRCWSIDPSLRPTSQDMHSELVIIQSSIAILNIISLRDLNNEAASLDLSKPSQTPNGEARSTLQDHDLTSGDKLIVTSSATRPLIRGFSRVDLIVGLTRALRDLLDELLIPDAIYPVFDHCLQALEDKQRTFRPERKETRRFLTFCVQLLQLSDDT
ncbi:kinase-like protein [Sistotremastrum niveocremeum HHB9708]|uniref:Kinase-like protein n=1 Tax=Sistotremastrum niveocremeum HHB9708 TaxID=1314777 RepID=A0A164P0V4_9AGAM|nr:kinase-like protein [Sistotremastrum niveocremeum HHB9708]